MSFDAAIARVAQLTNVSDSDKLQLYGLFKQVRNGDADDSSAPSRFNVVAYAKFSAWKQLKGLTPKQAEDRYIALVKKLDPSWRPPEVPPPQNGEIFHKTNGKTNNQGTEPLKQQYLPAENGAPPRPRTQSLDRAVFSLKAPANPPRLSNTLEKVLKLSSANPSTRPRAKSLDLESSFILPPVLNEDDVGMSVRRLVGPKDEHTGTMHVNGTLKGSAGKYDGKMNGRIGNDPSVTNIHPHPTERRVVEHLQGVGNFRDLGGLPAISASGKPGRTRYGQLVRCAQLSYATEKDAAWLINEFKLKTIVDLRSHDAAADGHFYKEFDHLNDHHQHERPRAVLRLPLISGELVRKMVFKHAPAWRRIQLIVLGILVKTVAFLRKVLAALPLAELIASRILAPLESYLRAKLLKASRLGFADSGLAALYERLLLDGKHELVRALHAYTRPDHLPAAVNCAFGKDRTGVISALVLLAAGVPKQVVIEDFTLSHNFVDTELGKREWANSIKEVPELEGKLDEWARSPAEYMTRALEAVERQYGSFDRYFKEYLGLDEKWVQQVRSNLVEEITDEEAIRGY